MPHHNRSRLIAIADQALDPQKKYIAGKNGTLKEEKSKKVSDANISQPLQASQIAIQDLPLKKDDVKILPIPEEVKKQAEPETLEVVESKIASVIQDQEMTPETPVEVPTVSVSNALESQVSLEPDLKEDKPLEKKKKKPFFTAT